MAGPWIPEVASVIDSSLTVLVFSITLITGSVHFWVSVFGDLGHWPGNDLNDFLAQPLI